jgi:hypothetical protein
MHRMKRETMVSKHRDEVMKINGITIYDLGFPKW